MDRFWHCTLWLGFYATQHVIFNAIHHFLQTKTAKAVGWAVVGWAVVSWARVGYEMGSCEMGSCEMGSEVTRYSSLRR